MQNPFRRIALSHPILTLLALAGAGLSGCGSSEDTSTTTTVAEPAEAAEPGEPGEPGAEKSPEPQAGAKVSSAGENLFQAPQPWTKDVSGLQKSPSSDAIVGWLANHGGWGTKRLRIEFSIK